MPINESHTSVTAGDQDEILDWDEGVKCRWLLTREDIPSGTTSGWSAGSSGGIHFRYFLLNFDKRHVDTVLHSYLPRVVQLYKAKMDKEEGIKIHTIRHESLHCRNA